MPEKPNPTLIVGLGGTGQWVATHVAYELKSLYGVASVTDLDPRVQILSIDTDFRQEAEIGHGARDDLGGVTVGQVRLPTSSMVPIGANVHAFVEQIFRNQRPESCSWFDAKWFLETTGAATLLDLTKGAGQYRPLGRLAVPYNLTQAKGQLRTNLQTAITTIKDHMVDGESLVVCVAGSLCGGTGAGMFIDVAHLVQMLAAPTVVHTRGYLVLPGAFEGTVPQTQEGPDAFRRRAFAAMRELRRFSREVSYISGYSMYYEESRNTASDAVLRGRLQKTLFELLYYFDTPLQRVKHTNGREELEKAPVKEGIAPLIAEAIMLWVDGKTSEDLLSHAANVSAIKGGKIAARQLDANAAVAGGMGVYSLFLPLDLIIEEWSHKLGREILKDFLGVLPEGGEDVESKTVTRLRPNWSGGAEGMSGKDAARSEWKRGTVAGSGVNAFIKDHLTTGLAGQSGRAAADKRKSELMTLKLDDWLTLISPAQDHGDDDAEMTKFLFPQHKVIEKGSGTLWGRVPDKVLKAEVLTTASLPGDAGKAEKKNPTAGADRVVREVNAFLNGHLGMVGEAMKRGGTDLYPEGTYPLILRRWSEGHLAQYRELLRAWVAFSLNGTSEPERQSNENDANAVRNRAGKLGYTVALLQELAAMLDQSSAILKFVEAIKLAVVINGRAITQEESNTAPMTIQAQETYLTEQERILQEERLYAIVRAARWASEQMHEFTHDTLQALQQWEKMLTKKLYAAVWKGQVQVEDNRRALDRYNAVRQPIDFAEYKASRYQYYAQDRGNAKGQILADLRWQLRIEGKYDQARQEFLPALTIGLNLGDAALAVDGGQITSRTFLIRCRSIFEQARQNETLLQWLRHQYDNSQDDRSISTLAATLKGKGKPALRMLDAANPYRLAYVRADYAEGSNDETWLRALGTQLAEIADADREESTPIKSSDPYRLTFLYFNELVDVEKLTSYQEGLEGIGGAGGYRALPAVSDGAGLAKQMLHVFAAERNAVVYEQRLGRLLSDKIVALLEDMERFRQFVSIWALGQFGQECEILLNMVQLPPDYPTAAGYWVRRCTTEPFAGEIDPITRRPLPPQHWWLSEPARVKPSLYTAAETFCLRGADIWQSGDPDRRLALDYARIQREIMRQLEAIRDQVSIQPRNANLKAVIQSMPNPVMKQQAEKKLSEYEFLQEIQIRLRDMILPAVEGEARTQRAGQAAIDRRESEYALDADLLYVVSQVLGDEMDALSKALTQLATPNVSVDAL